MAALSLYLHIPFCVQRCHYCAFARVADKKHWHAPYAAALITDIRSMCASVPYSTLRSLYIGGGTPSCFSPTALAQAMRTVSTAIPSTDSAEITIEANPQSCSSSFLATACAAGISRISLGVQSLNDDELRNLGRAHSVAAAHDAVQRIRTDAPHVALSVDLMCGIPGQTRASWQHTCTTVLEQWQPEHISLYMLSIEPGTRFSRAFNTPKTTMKWLSDEQTIALYWDAIDRCVAHGYEHYEIANLCRPGHHSRHNMAYWDTTQHYLGCGAGAHSFCQTTKHAPPRRFRCIKDIRTFCARVTQKQNYHAYTRQLSPHQQAGERIYLGLRRCDGVRLTTDDRALFATAIEQNCAAGLLQEKNTNYIALTRRGMEVASTVMADFCL